MDKKWINPKEFGCFQIGKTILEIGNRKRKNRISSKLFKFRMFILF